MAFSTLNLLQLFFSIQQFPCLVNSIQIFAGTSKLSGQSSTCLDIQEFSCIGDVCDSLAGPANNGACRNGDATSVQCQPNNFCSTPTPGHCLENTISVQGIHGMPDNKHFYCVNVINFDKPAILWEKNDCTGNNCFIPAAGYFNTWAIGAQANCVEIDPKTPIRTTPCLSPGQNGVFPPNGGFAAGVPEPVGGDYGLPASYTNSQTCSLIPNTSAAQPIPQNFKIPPAAGNFQLNPYRSNITDSDGIDELYRRSKRLGKRANAITRALRNGT